jgi:hypothetical protein
MSASVIQQRSDDIHSLSTPETFRWHIRPAFDRFTGNVYTGGSSFGCGKPYDAMTGWAFVVLDDAGRVVAAASGKPPPRIRSSNAIEAWAFYMAITLAAPGCSYRIDSMACVRTFHRGENNVRTRDSPDALLWKSIFNAINDKKQAMDVVWMPAHTKEAQIGKAKLGNGELITSADRKGNAMADAMAKHAAKEHRFLKHICTQEQELQHTLSKIPAVLLRSYALIEAIHLIRSHKRTYMHARAGAREGSQNRQDSASTTDKFTAVLQRQLRARTRFVCSICKFKNCDGLSCNPYDFQCV